jgi:hypothetical protein
MLGHHTVSIGEPGYQNKSIILRRRRSWGVDKHIKLQSNLNNADIDILPRSPEVRPAGRCKVRLIALQAMLDQLVRQNLKASSWQA